jgi:ribose transport system substrate-binding protein
MKRLVTVMMVLALLCGIVTAATAADAVKGKTIGFVNAGPDDYYAQFGKTLVAIAKSYGMNVVEVNSNYKPEKELANVQDLIAKGVDAIAVITAGAAGSAKSVEAANHAKVPIFFIAGKPDVPAGGAFQGHVTDNFVIMGYKIGQWVAKNYPKAICAEIPGFLGQGPAEGEIVGFQLALDEANMGKAIMLKSADWQRTKAIPVTEDLLASGKPFDVMFAANEETAGGVIQVFKEQNIKGKIIVSNNGKEDAWQWMKDGVMSATVPNPPSLNADLCIQQVVRYLQGQKFVADLQITPWDVLTKANVDKAIPWNTESYMKGRAANKFEWHLDYYEKQYLANTKMFDDFDAKLKAYMASH